MKPQTIHPKYRADIDGLRAVAVSVVVAFHAFPDAISGGFIGVDVFFVISGFLISTIIFTNVDRGSFQLVDFYARRVRRIFPALLVTLSIAMAVGWFVLLPSDYSQLGRHVVAGSTFVSNFILWGESGYFDAAAETKPLLHLWSLAIEEQFYLLFPLVVLAIKRFRGRRAAVLIVLGAISFGLNIFEIHSNPTKVFYSPQTRFWEVLIGAGLAHISLSGRENISDPLRSVLGGVGMVLIGAAVLLLDRQRHFPGFWALLPTVGAALLILAGPNSLPNRQFLSLPSLVFIGRISYPIYLWHWILLSYARIIGNGVPSVSVRVLAVVASVALAWLTFKLVEGPLRFGPFLRFKTVWLAAAMASVALAGVSLVMASGVPTRMKDRDAFDAYFEVSIPDLQYVERSGVLKYYRNDCNFYDMQQYRMNNSTNIPVDSIDPSCTTAEVGSKRVFLWGDSHVQQLYYGLTRSLPKDWDVLIVASSGCLPNVNVREDSEIDFCTRSNWSALNAIRNTAPDVIVVGQSADHSAETMGLIARDLNHISPKSRIVFTGPVPHWNAPLYKIIVSSGFWWYTPRRTFDGIDQSVIELDRKLKTGLSLPLYASFVSLIDTLCNSDGCLTYLGDDRMRGITAWDAAHLTLPASEFVAKQTLVSAVMGQPITSLP